MDFSESLPSPCFAAVSYRSGWILLTCDFVTCRFKDDDAGRKKMFEWCQNCDHPLKDTPFFRKIEPESLADSSDEDVESADRLDAALGELEPRDDIEHNYRLTNKIVRTLAILCIEKGHEIKSKLFLRLGAELLIILIAHEPESEPYIKELLREIGILGKSKE